jgi:single-stranded DNA-binding protein
MLNKVTLSGYLGKYVNTGTARNGKFYAQFQLSQYTGDPNNKYQYVPVFVIDNERSTPATRISQAQQGDYVVVECHIKAEKKQDGGQTRTELSLIVDSLRDVITPKPRENAPQTAQNQPSQPQYTPQYSVPQYSAPQYSTPQYGQQSNYSSEPSSGLGISSDDLPF